MNQVSCQYFTLVSLFVKVPILPNSAHGVKGNRMESFLRLCWNSKPRSSVRRISMFPWASLIRLSAVLCHSASPTVAWCPIRKSRMPGSRHSSKRIRIRQAVVLWPFQEIEPLARVERAGRRLGTCRRVSPASIKSSRVWTDTRVPVKHGVPCMISLSMVTMPASVARFSAATPSG